MTVITKRQLKIKGYIKCKRISKKEILFYFGEYILINKGGGGQKFKFYLFF